MKKLLFAVAVCASMMAFSQGSAADKRLAANAKLCAMSVEEFKALTPAEQKAKVNEANLKNRARWCGMSVEDFKALKPAEQVKRINAAKKARAAAAKAKKAKKTAE